MSAVPKPLTATEARPAARVVIGDRLLLAGLIAALLLITAVPYLYATRSAPPGRVFMGILFDVPDVAQYWSWMRDHHAGLLVPNRMTAEPVHASDTAGYPAAAVLGPALKKSRRCSRPPMTTLFQRRDLSASFVWRALFKAGGRVVLE